MRGFSGIPGMFDVQPNVTLRVSPRLDGGRKWRRNVKFMAYDINPVTTEEEIAEFLAPLGAVLDVKIIREGNADKPAAIIEMDVTPGRATAIAERFNQRVSQRGNRVRVHVLPERS